MKKQLSIPMNRTEIILGWIYLVFQLIVLPDLISLVCWIAGLSPSNAEINFVFFATNFLCVTLIFHGFLIASGKLSLEAPFYCLRFAFFAFVGYWVLSYLLGIVILFVFPDFYNVNDSSIASMAQENYPLMTLGTVVLVPIVEELFYRGLIFGQLYNKNRFLAYLISTIAFSALHILAYIGHYGTTHLLVCMLQYVPAGLCLAWAYAKTDSIWASILMHMAINEISMFSMR